MRLKEKRQLISAIVNSFHEAGEFYQLEAELDPTVEEDILKEMKNLRKQRKDLVKLSELYIIRDNILAIRRKE